MYGVFWGLTGATGGNTGAGVQSQALGKIKGVNSKASISIFFY
jgi:hypothetical protein